MGRTTQADGGKLVTDQAGQAGSSKQADQASASKLDQAGQAKGRQAGSSWWVVLAWDYAAGKLPKKAYKTRRQAEQARWRAVKRDPLLYTCTMLACYRTREQARWAEVTDPFGEESGRLIIR